MTFELKCFVAEAVCLVGLSICYAITACSATTAKAVNSVAVTVADDVCKELEADGGASDWVALLCQVPDVEGGIVKVFLPRTKWAAIKAGAK